MRMEAELSRKKTDFKIDDGKIFKYDFNVEKSSSADT